MKLGVLFFKYIVCNSDSERQDVIALCELLGLKPYNEYVMGIDFGLAPDVLVSEISRTYQPTSKSIYEGLNMPAKEFIDTYFK